jgi:hypothetical protein
MEDRPSFYEFLTANSKITKREANKTPKVYIAISWLVLLFTNAALLWAGWNYAVVHLFGTNPATYAQCILLYLVAKILTRGLFSVE